MASPGYAGSSRPVRPWADHGRIPNEVASWVDLPDDADSPTEYVASDLSDVDPPAGRRVTSSSSAAARATTSSSRPAACRWRASGDGCGARCGPDATRQADRSTRTRVEDWLRWLSGFAPIVSTGSPCRPSGCGSG